LAVKSTFAVVALGSVGDEHATSQTAVDASTAALLLLGIVSLLFIDPPPYPSPRRGRGTLMRVWLRHFSSTPLAIPS